MSRFLTSVWSKPEAHIVGVSAQGAAWVSQDQGQAYRWHQINWDTTQTPGDSVQALIPQLQWSSTTPIAWIAAPSLLRHWLQKPPEQIQSLRELHAVTLARATQLFGTPNMTGASRSASWKIAGDWHASQAYLCSALPDSWQTALQNHAFEGSHCICSPLQLAMATFKPSLPQQGWVALMAADALNLMYFELGRLSYFRSIQLPKQQTAEELQALVIAEWRRDMLRTQFKADHLHWLGLTDETQDILAAVSEIRPMASNIGASLTFLPNKPEGLSGSNTIASGDLDEAQQAVWCALRCRGAWHA